MQPNQIRSGTQLLVEGKDGKNFFGALCRHLGLTHVQIQNYGGVDELRGFLGAFVRMPDFGTVKRLGIVRDAEASAERAFQSIQSGLEGANLPVPPAPGMLSEDTPQVSVLVLPEEGGGMLETIVARSFAGTPEDMCIDGFFECIKANGRTFRRPDKSRVAAYLATTASPHMSVGVAALQQVWNFNHEAFSTMRSYLENLEGTSA